MAQAMRAAGIRAEACPVHQTLKPCEHCERIFVRAESQRLQHDRAEGQRLHAEWLAERKKRGSIARNPRQ
jgi:hypothetical protein